MKAPDSGPGPSLFSGEKPLDVRKAFRHTDPMSNTADIRIKINSAYQERALATAVARVGQLDAGRCDVRKTVAHLSPAWAQSVGVELADMRLEVLMSNEPDRRGRLNAINSILRHLRATGVTW